MKTFMKSSFFIVLLMAVFSMGINQAYAKEANTGKKITKTKTVNTSRAVSISCQMQSISDFMTALENSSRDDLNLAAFPAEPTCEPKTYRNGNYVLIIKSNCEVKRERIDPFGD